MAKEYASIISGQSDGGPVIVGGWSFGGVVAFEIACILMKEGVDVKGVVLIDSPCPTNHVPLTLNLLDQIVGKAKASRSETEAMGYVKEQFGRCSALLGRHAPTLDGPQPRAVFLWSTQGVKVKEMQDEVPAWLGDRDGPESMVGEWETALKGTIKRWDIPGDHFQPFLPANVEETSRCVAEACSYLDSDGGEPVSQ